LFLKIYIVLLNIHCHTLLTEAYSCGDNFFSQRQLKYLVTILPFYLFFILLKMIRHICIAAICLYT
jgi:hypothetical protein